MEWFRFDTLNIGDVLAMTNRSTIRFFCAVFAAFLTATCLVATASAEPDLERRAAEAVSAWQGTDLYEQARRLRERFGLVPRRTEAWSKLELEALEHGAELVPRNVRARLPTPMFLERRERVCGFGQGVGSETCPRFDASGRTFFLYDVGEISHQLQRRVLTGLEGDEQKRLLYRRAAVHLFVSRADRQMEWSKRRSWRTINGWEHGEPLNRDWLGFSRPLGRGSAHLDFVTFAEEFFARPEDVLRDIGATERLETFDPNESVACRMMTRSRYLRDVTADVAPEWDLPARANQDELDGEWNAAGTGCPSFEQWADFENVRGLELIYASASSENPESLFGHLLLRISYGPEADIFREGFEPTYQFGAVTGSHVTTVGYFAQGLFGGFPSVLEFNTSRASERIYLRYERRNLRNFRLHLSRDQQLQTMQRIWEGQRHIRYPYYFFQHNCASFVVDLLRPVVGRDLEGLPSIAVMPTDVLDAFAATRNDRVDEPAFLEQRYRRILSSEARAVRAVRERRRVVEQLPNLRSNGFEGKGFMGLHRDIESMQPDSRRDAYESLEGHLQNGVEPDVARTLVDYLYYSSVIERYFVERARYARLERLSDTSGRNVRFTIQDRLQLRREIYRIEELKERLQAWRKRMRQRVAPITEAMEAGVEATDRSERLRGSYMGSLEALSEAISRIGEEWEGEEYERRREQRFTAEHYTRQKSAIGPSGAWRGAVGLYGARGHLPAGSSDSLETRAGFELDIAFLRDELGEFRVRGFRPEVESRSFDLELQAWLGREWQKRLRAEMILYRFLSLNNKPAPLRDTWRDALGWGVDSGVRHDGARGLHFGGWLSGGLIVPFFQSEVGVDYLALSVMADGRGDIARDSALLLGGRSFLRGQVHLGGNYGNVGRLKLETHQYSTIQGEWEFESSARVSTRHALSDVSNRPIWLVPFVEGGYSSIDYTDDSDLFDLRGGLRIEYPL